MYLDLSKHGVRLEEANKRHARELSRCMRQSDRLEIRASGNLMPEQAVRASINLSTQAWAAYIGRDLMCVFGVVKFPGPISDTCVWMLGSSALERYPLTLWKASKAAVEALRGDNPLLFNHVLATSRTTLSWLQRLGFTVGQPEPWGVSGRLFCPVHLITKKLIYTEERANV